MDQEKWRQVGNYFVSSLGRVKTSSGRVLSGCKSQSGHIYVHLDKGKVLVSTLVANAFIDGLGKVYHKNGDLTDNRLCNLERR